MGAGFRLTLKWGFPVHSNYSSCSPYRFSSSFVGGREASVSLSRLSLLSLFSEEGYNYPLKMHASSSAVHTIGKDCSVREGLKVNTDKAPGGPNNMVDDTGLLAEEGTPDISFKERGSSRFSWLMENLDLLEKSFADSDTLKLQRDILLQLGRLGALKLFNTCLSRSLKNSNMLDLTNVPTKNIEENNASGTPENPKAEIIVRTRKKEERKFRRKRASSRDGCKATSMPLPSKIMENDHENSGISPAKNSLKSKSRRLMIARNEAEMSEGVKMVSDLERIRATLEEETGRVISLSCWAEAAGLDKKVLQQQLRFGWYCRDELIKSTRSLVLYIARNYRIKGIALDDLLQAGRLGVLQGAERFDHTRGFRFSTYIQYWIRKSMLTTVAQHSRGIQIPVCTFLSCREVIYLIIFWFWLAYILFFFFWFQCALRRIINRIQRAEKALSNCHGKHPDDIEIARFTGLSLAKIESANKCLRVVGSVDQKIGGCMNAKYLEYIPDMSIQTPEAFVTRQQMKEDIYNLLSGLNSTEIQVLALRYGFRDHQPKSFGEIGRLLRLSKQGVRNIEKKVITRLKNEESCQYLRHYINL
nr:plastidic RNA polymerase sigma-subunit 3 [Passiflora contracta]